MSVMSFLADRTRTSLLLSRKEELRQLEQHVLARVSNLDEREKAISGTETTLAAREAACSTREEENRETQRKLNLAAEALRGYWDKLRGEKEREKETVGLGLPGLPEERAPPRRSSAVPVRPPLEERNTVPLAAVPRCPRNPHPAYEDTPSKIPLAATIASPVRLDRFANFPARSATPLRRNATKSLGNLAAAARADAEREATWSGAIEATPARQAIPFSRHQRTSIGSPSELKAGWCEDISMASPAMSIASPGPISHRPRRSSVAPSAFTSHQSQNSTNPSLTSVSSSESIESQRSATSMGSDVSGSKTAMILPTMIPVPTFVYREAATPARWAPEDPDLPSPFIRRYATASPIPTSNTERQPLGAISVQPTMQPPQHLGKGPTKCAPMPRSKSGNLHQHVLRVNAQQALAGRTSGEGVRARAAALSKEAAKVMGA